MYINLHIVKEDKKELSDDLKQVRKKLKEVIEGIKTKKTPLKKANTIIYACSNITRTIITELYLINTIELDN